MKQIERIITMLVVTALLHVAMLVREVSSVPDTTPRDVSVETAYVGNTYQCQWNFCWASFHHKGKKLYRQFRSGDILTLEQGYRGLYPERGWVKVRSGGGSKSFTRHYGHRIP